MKTARDTALCALRAVRRQDAWIDGALKEQLSRDRLDARDAALAAQLCFGVTQNRMLLDFYLSQLVHGKLTALQPVVLDILRLGAYQLLFLQKIPPSAAVNEAVNQARREANPKAAGLVNGVLRALLRSKDALKEPESLSVRYSHPQELTELLRQAVGEAQLEPLLQADNAPAPTVLQYNPLKTTPQALEAELLAAGVRVQAHPWLQGAFLVSGTGAISALDAFREGRCTVQDVSSRLCALALGAKPGMQMLDCCAAPGGKSFAAAMQMENRGSLLSCDIHAHKLTLMEKGAQRLGVSILHTRLLDARERQPELLGAMDAVLADVPCSGLGVIRKKPDVRYKELSRLSQLPPIQRGILENVSAYVKPGGVLVYSTCTILPRENEEICTDFLRTHPEFSPEPFPVPAGFALENEGMLTLYPHIHGCDGFFICKMRRNT